MTNGFLLVFLVVISTSCSSQTDNRSQLAVNVLEDDMSSTDYTALVQITGMVVDNPPDNSSELVAIGYSAQIMEVYVGRELEDIRFTRYVEKGEEPEATDDRIQIVSLCRDINGEYYLPDIGYELPPDEAIIRQARRSIAQASDTTSPGQKVDTSSACY